jgi:Zn-dependent protease
MTASVVVLILFTFAATLFHVLVAIERSVWRAAFPRAVAAEVRETDLRFVHQSLKRLIPVLPPSNGVAVIGGFAALKPSPKDARKPRLMPPPDN